MERTVLSGALLGLGVAAFVDETVFHQLLHWHHFYDKSTNAVGLVSDGIFHAFSWFATVAALFLLADVRRRRVFVARRWWGGLLAAAGAFQLYDGTIQHKLLGLHQIRYHVDVTPYDWAWNVIAVALIAVGATLLITARRRPARAADGSAGGGADGSAAGGAAGSAAGGAAGSAAGGSAAR
ncbi:DUF2243 domain-containing protein [Cryptosporangium sp. NPDC048952]|uniref:DUF2243 domain-containing protein n=1 Tax=Cryptosporangium sp. NPDC048952 TaxID=3363961 RepID=UPI003722D5DE